MDKPTAISIIIIFSTFFTILTNAQSPQEVQAWFESFTHSNHPEKMTNLHFYFHDFLRGKNATSVEVARAANITDSSPTFFGSFITADDPLTVGPALSSKRVGYARGFYGAASMEEVGLVFAMSFVFTDGKFNGSTLSVLGHNPYNHLYREMPIVGGTGAFRLARGVSTWKTYFFDPPAGNATVDIHVSVLHY